MKKLRQWLNFFRRRKLDAEMTEEMRVHLEMQIERHVRDGVNPDEARDLALRQFGNVASVQERVRERRGWIGLEQLGKEFQFALRRLRRAPGFTGTVLITLAICLGANLAIFTLVDGILLRPLPFPEADRLTLIYNTYPNAGVERDGSSVTNYYERRGHLPAFAGLALYRPTQAMVGEANLVHRETVIQVSTEFFDVIGRGPGLGRGFSETEMTFQGPRVVIVSDAWWRRELNADPQVIGRQVVVNGQARTVVGVLPPDFRFLSYNSGLFFPLQSAPQDRASTARHSGGNVTQMIGRLNPGVSLRTAQAQVDANNAAMELDDPQAAMITAAGFRSVVVSLHADHVASVRRTLWLMQAGGLCLLLMGIVNLWNLLLIRASGRSHELAVRQALGASRRNLATEVLAEIVLLTLGGGALGFGVGIAGIRLMSALGSGQLPLGAHLAFDGRLAIALMIGAVISGLTIGLPLWWLSMGRTSWHGLQTAPRTSTASRPLRRMRAGLIVLQVGLALVLLIAAGQLALSLKRSLEVSTGFQPSRVLTGKVWLSPTSARDGAGLASLAEKISDSAAQLPGTRAAGLITNIPFSGASGKSAATVKGWVAKPGESPRANYSYSVIGDYFTAMGMPLLSGRFLTAEDSRRPERVCVVDEVFAKTYWPRGGVIGQQLFEGSKVGPDGEAFTVVGVVGAVKQVGLTDPESPGAVYYPLGHRPDRDLYLVVSTPGTPNIYGEALRRAFQKLDPNLPLTGLSTMESRISASLVTRSSPAVLSGIFSFVALLLAAIGIYGVLGYAVTQQYRETGIRLALGARTEEIRRHYLRFGLQLLLIGIVAGTIGAWLTGRVLQTVLYAVPVFSFPIWMTAVVVLSSVTFFACWLPARRAAKVDPVIALRSE